MRDHKELRFILACSSHSKNLREATDPLKPSWLLYKTVCRSSLLSLLFNCKSWTKDASPILWCFNLILSRYWNPFLFLSFLVEKQAFTTVSISFCKATMLTSLIIFEEQLMFAAEVQGSFCELMIVVRMMTLVCIVVPLLCIWEGFCVAIMAMKMKPAAVLVLLLAPVIWFYCHMKIHFQIRTWNIKTYMVLSINFIFCMHTFYTITYKCYKLVVEQTYSVLEQLPDC